MYTDKEKLSKIIKLLKAVENNDVELTKNIVNDLNADYSINQIKDSYFNKTLIDNNDVDNESYKYMIYNLNYLANEDVIQWNYEIKHLLDRFNFREMRKFVFEQISHDIPEYKKPALSQICITIDRYDLLNRIRGMEEG